MLNTDEKRGDRQTEGEREMREGGIGIDARLRGEGEDKEEGERIGGKRERATNLLRQ